MTFCAHINVDKYYHHHHYYYEYHFNQQYANSTPKSKNVINDN